uniref:Uncharacterized protein n=1 Tax=Cyanothece sp. (strain PCC 7425 / ATCC 29141) TaxID=395961 RepID=B8HTS2_CYAP4
MLSANQFNSQKHPQSFVHQQAAAVYLNCKNALNQQDWARLQQQAKELHKVAQQADQLILEVQTQLLEQAALQRDLSRATNLVTRIATSLTHLKTASADVPKEVVDHPANGPDSASKRLGAYLVEAELLTQAQIDVALADQRATGARLGEILAARGWIKQGTIEFLMEKVIMPDRKQVDPPPPPRPQFQQATRPSVAAQETLVDPFG